MFRNRVGGPAGGIAAIALASAVLASAAFAATDLVQREGVDGCIAENGLSGQCRDGDGVVGPAGVVLSPDGANAYVAASRNGSFNSVVALGRDGDGTLQPIAGPAGCLAEVEFSNSPCDPAGHGLLGAEGIAVSPDGRNVYVAASEADAVAILDRDPETGLLTQSATAGGCFSLGGADECEEGRALDDARSVSVSPDGKNVYVAARGDDGGIAVFDRDPETGGLTQPPGEAGCINESGAEGCADAFTVRTAPEEVELSPGGDFAYIASRPGDELVGFSRDSSDGTLARIPGQGGCVNETGVDGCVAAKALGEPVALTFDADGRTLYAAAERNDAIVVFDRDPESGTLDEKPGLDGCVSNTGVANPTQGSSTEQQCQNGIALDGVGSLAVSPDGTALYASAGLADGVAIFERRADGTLSQRPGSSGCITETGYELPAAYWTAGYCLDGRALIEAGSVAVGPDSRQLYATARNGGIDTFDVVPPPAPPAVVETPPPPPTVVPPRNRRPCKRIVKKRRTVTRALAKALRRQRRLRRQLRRGGGSKAQTGALVATHSRVKKLRRVRHLARHRERRVCR
jgi:DNA-binding beta-propeller fold protein YncE